MNMIYGFDMLSVYLQQCDQQLQSSYVRCIVL